MTQPLEERAGFGRLMALAQAEASIPVDPAIDALGRTRFMDHAQDRAGRQSRVGSWFGPVPRLAWALSAVLLLCGVAWGIASRPISYVVEGASAAQDYIRANQEQPARILFSDGTRVDAASGARLRIEERNSRGARVLLDRGRAVAQVAHRAGSTWRFIAGPFEVQVKGTKFALEWDPTTEHLRLKLDEGVVDVLGPIGPGRVEVRAGQELQADLAQRSLTVVDGVQGEPLHANAAPSVSPSASARVGSNAAALVEQPGSVHESPNLSAAPNARAIAQVQLDQQAAKGTQELPPSIGSAATNSQTSPQQLSWPKLLAQGKFEAIVRLAESPDRPNCAEVCSATDLRTLAEAARYVGRLDLSESSLLALRRRFPDHAEGKRAAFLLARLYESRADRGRAENWYRTYLVESPSSELSREALAGQMRVVARARGPKAAEPLAREYLHRYPGGADASLARQILGED